MLAAGAALLTVIAFRAHLDPWLFGVLLILTWVLLAIGLRVAAIPRPLWLLVSVSSLALAFVAWNHLAPQARLQLGGVRLQSLPSTESPGLVEMTVRNSGSVAAAVAIEQAGHLASLFENARQLSGSGLERELSGRLTKDAAGDIVIPPGQTARVDVAIPASQRSWLIGRGQATVLVTARLRYRDRIFPREQSFCLFASTRSEAWAPCPFLNE